MYTDIFSSSDFFMYGVYHHDLPSFYTDELLHENMQFNIHNGNYILTCQLYILLSHHEYIHDPYCLKLYY